MKKLYIILAVAFVAIAAGLIYYGNFSTPENTLEIQKKIKEDFKGKGIRSNKIIKPNLQRRMDKDTIKRLIMIKQKERRENLNKQDAEAPAQAGKNVEKTAEPVKKPVEPVKKPAEPVKKLEKK